MAENIIAAHPINMHYLTNSEIMLSCEGEQIKDQVKYLEDQINILKIRLDALSNQVATNTADIDLLQKEKLGPDTSIATAKPKQKSDLEIFSRIEPSEDFLKLEGNMFIS